MDGTGDFISDGLRPCVNVSMFACRYFNIRMFFRGFLGTENTYRSNTKAVSYDRIMNITLLMHCIGETFPVDISEQKWQ